VSRYRPCDADVILTRSHSSISPFERCLVRSLASFDSNRGTISSIRNGHKPVGVEVFGMEGGMEGEMGKGL
jgi:hypothetical protein